jgi:hypothetical protein
MSPVKTLWVPDPLRHQPHQTPGERLFQRLVGELVPFGGIQRDDPLAAGMVDLPPAIAAAGGARRSQAILQGAAFERRIDSGMGNRAGGTRRVIPRRDRPIG